MTAPTLVAALNALPPDAEMLSSLAATGDPWIPACAGMTSQGAGMTRRGAGMTRQGAGMMGRDGGMNHV
jgi:hypothetical protein